MFGFHVSSDLRNFVQKCNSLFRGPFSLLERLKPLRFTAAERGATVAEYSLLLALVVVILIGTLTQLGQALNNKLQAIIDQIRSAQ